MPSRMRVRVGTLTTAMLVLLIPVGVTGCGSSGSTSPSGSPSSSASVAFAALPDSVLTSIDGATYATSQAADKAMATTHVGETLSAFTGGISRDLVVGGQTVGGVQVYQFAPDVAASQRALFVPMMIFTSSATTPHPAQIGGKVVQVVDSRASDGAAVVGWTQQDQVVLLWAKDLATAKDYAARYILRSFGS